MKNRAFTLLEIVICVAILGIIGSVIGWQAKEMIQTHRFRKSVAMLFADLRKAQMLSLCRRTDIELEIAPIKDGYSYLLRSDEPISELTKKPTKLRGVKKMGVGVLHIHPSGRVTGVNALEIFQDEEQGFAIKLEDTPFLELATIKKEN